MLLLNGAGGSANDPVLEDLPLSLIGGADTLDLSQNIRAYIDQTSGTGVNEVTSGLSPDPTTIFLAGTNGVWDAGTRTLNVTSNAGLSAGDYLYVDNGITAALVRIESVSGSNAVVLDETVFPSNANGVSYEVHYTYETMFTDSGVLRATSAGQINYWKFQGEDSFGNRGVVEDAIYGRLDPPGNQFISINGGNFSGQTIPVFNPTFDILPNWPNRGGILTLELVNTTGMRWWDGSVGEKLLSNILSQDANGRLQLFGGDGLKSAVLRMRTKQGSPNYRDVPISVTVDSTAPNLIVTVRGR